MGPSMQRKRTNPVCRQRVQCTLSLGVYRLPVAKSAILCPQQRKQAETDLLDIGDLGGEAL